MTSIKLAHVSASESKVKRRRI